MNRPWHHVGAFVSRAAKAVKQLRRRRSQAPSLERIDALAEQLFQFGKDSDVAYTEIAKGISLLNERIREVALKATQLRAVLNDDDEDKALQSAYAVYKGSVDLVHASMGVALADHDWLEKVETRLLKACEAKSSLEKYSLVFRTVTVETKIEATRLDHSERMVFETVAGAIQHMERKITETATTAFGKIEEVVIETREERNRLHDHQMRLHEEAQASVGTIRRELDSLRTALEPCANESKEVEGLVDAINGAIGEVVKALQSQDIVRQQLEHVVEGLRDIRKHEGEHGLMLQASRVQTGQLRAAKDRISRAGNTLSAGLERLSLTSNTLLEHFLSMEKAAENAFKDCKLATLFKVETEKLANVANESERSNQRIAQLVTRVDSVIHAFSEEVSGHEFNVKLVALNAQVAAAQIEKAGGLNCLAEETSRVSGEVAAMTTEMTADLREALDTLRTMKTDADGFQEIILRDKGELEAKAGHVNVKLEGLQHQIEAESKRARNQFAEMNEAVTQLRAEFTPEVSIEQGLAPAIAFCEELTAWCSEDPDTLESAASYEAVAGRYTMEQEYETHRNALGQDAQTETTPAEGKDDDIQLF